MKTRGYWDTVRLALGLLLICVVTPAHGAIDASPPASAPSGPLKFKRPPLRFEINEGQTDPEVQFTVRGNDGISFLTPGGAVFQIPGAVNEQSHSFELSYVTLKLAGASPNPQIAGLDRLPGVTNYFLGADPRAWRTNVAGYAKVTYDDIYPGIDLLYYDNGEGHLEYDFIVAPGADPSRIALSVEGAQAVELDPSGGLILRAATGNIHQPHPRIYQEIGGKRKEIAGGYRIAGSSDRPTVTFQLEAYDRKRPLVIDPQVIYATYLGGTSSSTVGNEGARSVAVDAQGSVYIVGDAISADFPTRNPAQRALLGFANAFVTKLDAGGQVVYSTYLGGGSFDTGSVIKVDDTGAVYVAGTTSSLNFPTADPIQGRAGGRNDAFVTKLSASGSQLVYSTYLGGTDNEIATDLAVDTQKSVFVLGSVSPALGVSPNNFPTANPIQPAYGGGPRDGFLSVVNATGSSLPFSTYLGGDGDDFFQSIAFGGINGEIHLGFFTDSSSLTVGAAASLNASTNATTDATTDAGPVAYAAVSNLSGAGIHIFTLRPSPRSRYVFVSGTLAETYRQAEAASRTFEAMLERSQREQALADDKAWEFLHGISTAFAGAPGEPEPLSAQPLEAQTLGGLDVRLQILDQNLNITKTAFFGGTGEDTVSAIASDKNGAAYVIGRTRSTNLPTINPIQETHSGGNAFDGFLAVFQAGTLEPAFATYLGGTGTEFLTSVTVDQQGNIYVVGETAGGFPAPTAGAIQNELRGRTDAFVIKLAPAIAAPSNLGVWPFRISDRGGISVTTRGGPEPTAVGYARIQPGAGNSAPSGMAIFGFRQAGVLVTEAAVPASQVLQSGRIYAEVNGPVNTGLAIANPNGQPAALSFNFTDTAGQNFGSGTTTIAANSQIAAFLDQAPFNGGSRVNGTFSFSSSVPVSVVALRGFTNERAEFLITTLPVVDLAAAAPVGETIIFPHFAEGGGWTTQVVLINPADAALNGQVQFLTPSGGPATLTIDGQSTNTFAYSIAGRSSRVFRTSGLGQMQVGSIRIVPSVGSPTPSGVGIFTFKSGQTTVSEAGVPALRAAAAVRLFTEASGNFAASQPGSIGAGIAVANSTPNPATVSFELTRLDGTSTGLTGSINVPANGQTALFLNQIPVFSPLGSPAVPFQGVLRISSGRAPISVVGLRGRYNERGDFLITTIAPVDESKAPFAGETFFPHLADSGGYTTQFVLFSGSTGQSSTGMLRVLSQSGQPFNVSLQ